MGVEADPGPDYSCAVWAVESGGGGFELGLFDGCSLLSDSVLVFYIVVEVIMLPYFLTCHLKS